MKYTPITDVMHQFEIIGLMIKAVRKCSQFKIKLCQRPKPDDDDIMLCDIDFSKLRDRKRFKIRFSIPMHEKGFVHGNNGGLLASDENGDLYLCRQGEASSNEQELNYATTGNALPFSKTWSGVVLPWFRVQWATKSGADKYRIYYPLICLSLGDDRIVDDICSLLEHI